jgi:hypothetical protein
MSVEKALEEGGRKKWMKGQSSGVGNGILAKLPPTGDFLMTLRCHDRKTAIVGKIFLILTQHLPLY